MVFCYMFFLYSDCKGGLAGGVGEGLGRVCLSILDKTRLKSPIGSPWLIYVLLSRCLALFRAHA